MEELGPGPVMEELDRLSAIASGRVEAAEGERLRRLEPTWGCGGGLRGSSAAGHRKKTSQRRGAA